MQELYTRAPVTKILGDEFKKPRPQYLDITAALAANAIESTDKAFSITAKHQVSTTFRPNSVSTNIQTTYAAPVTPLHPRPAPQKYRPIQHPTNQFSTYRPENLPLPMAPTKITPVPVAMKLTSAPSPFNIRATPTIRPKVQHLLATIGLEPDVPSTHTLPQQSAFNDLSASASSHPAFSTVPTQLNVAPEAKPTTTTVSKTTSTTTTTTAKPELTPELKELLESFGFLTDEVSTPQPTATAVTHEDELEPIFHSLSDDSLSVDEFKPLPTSVTQSDIKKRIGGTYEIRSDDFASFKRLPTAEDVASDDEFEDLLKTYGLYETSNVRDMKAIDETETDEKQISDRIDVSTTAEAFNENEKKLSQVPEVDVAFLSPHLTQVLGSIGVKQVNSNEDKSNDLIAIKELEERVKSKAAATTTTTTTTSTTTTTTTESPRPVYAPNVDPITLSPGHEIQKLHYLLDTIRQLETLNQDIAKNQSQTVDDSHPNNKKQNHVADPLDDSYENDDRIRNEVKRQLNASSPTKITLDLPASTPLAFDEFTTNDKSSSTSSTTTTTTEDSDSESRQAKKDDDSVADESVVSSTTEETKNGDLRDLADSFGGNDGLDTMPDESLPPPRKNGFYFFSDWNSFLEVGEEPDKVVVRFDPKIGDSSPFIPVKIP